MMYLPTPDYWGNYISHHGILGMHWGKRNGPPYPLGSDVSTGKRLKTTFVSGSSKTQDKSSPYYQRKLPKDLRKELKGKMKSGNRIIVGDAPGIDRQVQDYLKKKRYKNVEVYSPGKESRYLANKKWKNYLIDDPKHEPMSPEWLAKKDKAMAKVADDGIAVVLDKGSQATRNNIKRLQKKGKNVSVYTLNSKEDKGSLKNLLVNYSKVNLNAAKKFYLNPVGEYKKYFKGGINEWKTAIKNPKQYLKSAYKEYKQITEKLKKKDGYKLLTDREKMLMVMNSDDVDSSWINNFNNYNYWNHF